MFPFLEKTLNLDVLDRNKQWRNTKREMCFYFISIFKYNLDFTSDCGIHSLDLWITGHL